MLFDKEYDKSLWLILSGGKVDVDSVVNFIKYIPDVLLNSLHEDINAYKTYKKSGGSSVLTTQLSKKIKNKDGIIYWYSISPQNGALEVGETFSTEEDYFNTSVVTLFPITESDIHNLGKTEEKTLGEYDFVYHICRDEDYEYVVVDEAIEFILIKNMFNQNKIETCEILPKYKERRRLVDVGMMPKDLTKDDLKVENFDRRLIRRKIKNSK